MEALFALPQQWMDALTGWLAANPQLCGWFTSIVRFVFPVLALLILIRSIRSLLTVPHLPEVWAYLTLPNGSGEPLTHWENILGRGGACDVVLNYPVVSRQHAALIRREDDTWTVHDLGSTGGVTVNGTAVEGSAPVAYGDVLGLGGVETVLLPVSPEEKAQRRHRRRAAKPASPWLGLVLLTVFQVLCALQLILSAGAQATLNLPGAFLCLSLVMWLYFLTMRLLRRVGFEMETIAFFLSTLSLAITASSAPSALFKQFLALLLGLVLFLILGVFLRDLERAKHIRWLMAAADTDLVFGMLCEEWGLIIAALAVLSVFTLAVFAVRACRAGRSSFYTIAACAATSMMVFQTCLNVFGAVDLLPLTGVTFPFVSNGGSSMLASWGLLAFLKATDTRQNASFAIRLPSRREDRRGAALAPRDTEGWEQEADDEED